MDIAMSTGSLKKPTRPPPPPPSRQYNHHDYIKISDCLTGLPKMHHQKSLSLNDKPSYLRLDLGAPKPPTPSKRFTEYKSVDFSKTEALTKCKIEREINKD